MYSILNPHNKLQYHPLDIPVLCHSHTIAHPLDIHHEQPRNFDPKITCARCQPRNLGPSTPATLTSRMHATSDPIQSHKALPNRSETESDIPHEAAQPLTTRASSFLHSRDASIMVHADSRIPPTSTSTFPSQHSHQWPVRHDVDPSTPSTSIPSSTQPLSTTATLIRHPSTATEHLVLGEEHVH
ncbi:hypothetical protein NLJ89_g10513 [Agrocybe chaxingu]|uniref:Uncharacterized protein n=1 Tax=Agrocybe chaxingu TaxID=84603 RepID=A0A9W8JRN3_9AGAR|nr:hypothetical protein NLJ89_g10513 [Agrocybe chaxingu]